VPARTSGRCGCVDDGRCRRRCGLHWRGRLRQEQPVRVDESGSGVVVPAGGLEVGRRVEQAAVTWAGVADGFAARYSEATALTAGAAIDVPEPAA
jgi:hypothetical protein